MKVITIDGPSGVGKSSVAKAVAERLGYRYLDTGAMYRAATLGLIEAGGLNGAGAPRPQASEAETASLLDALRIELDTSGRVTLNGRDVEEAIRSGPVTRAVSAVSALPTVRRRMRKLQQRFGRDGRIVAEGRDMGSVVFPDAEHKFFLDADPRERARRRARQLYGDGGTDAIIDGILADQARRDRLDSEREYSPLMATDDMIRIDSTHLTLVEVTERIVSEVLASGEDPAQIE